MAGFPEFSAVLFDQHLSVESYEQQLYGDGSRLFSNCSCLQRIRNKLSACVLTGQAERLLYAGFASFALHRLIHWKNGKLRLSKASICLLSVAVGGVIYGALHLISGGFEAINHKMKNYLNKSLKETRAVFFDQIEGFRKCCEHLEDEFFSEALKESSADLKWFKESAEKISDLELRYTALNAVFAREGIEPLPEDGLAVFLKVAQKV